MTNLLNHLRPATLAQLAAELIADHAEEIGNYTFDFHTEAAKNAYSDILEAAVATYGEAEFFSLFSAAL